jgi:hypothetical protein
MNVVVAKHGAPGMDEDGKQNISRTWEMVIANISSHIRTIPKLEAIVDPFFRAEREVELESVEMQREHRW